MQLLLVTSELAASLTGLYNWSCSFSVSKQCAKYYRCGSIQPGDQLLSIDNIPLDACTVDESVRLLQSSSDVVKIRIKKPASGVDLPESAPKTVVYSVELSRKNGPLGITIAGVDDRSEPIIISQLTKGGLAERCVQDVFDGW